MRWGQILQSDKVQMFNFWPQNGTKVPLHESDNLLQRPFSAQLQWVEMKQDWSCSEKIQIFHTLPQNGTRLPLSTLTLLFHESDNFLQSPFAQNRFVRFILHLHRTLLKQASKPSVSQKSFKQAFNKFNKLKVKDTRTSGSLKKRDILIDKGSIRKNYSFSWNAQLRFC